MRRTLTAIFLTLAACAVAFGQDNIVAAREELNAGARMYREEKFVEAEKHFRRALELNPESMNARLFIARIVQKQYKPGVEDSENIAVGERAIAAYQEALQIDPTNDDAYKAIAFLYGQMKNDDKVRETHLQRANNYSLPNEKRAEPLIILASKQWQCSYDITEQPLNKTTVRSQGRVVVAYKMPADAAEFYKAQQCATEGLQLAEQAVSLDQENANAWTQKANLLREAVKIAEMEGNKEQKAEYERLAGEARATQSRLSNAALSDAGRAGKKAEEKVPTTPTRVPTTPTQVPTTPRKTVISGGVLNVKAIAKPQPAYPANAKAARAQGSVTVQIIVDEDGKVISANAVSGHPLLQEAAVAAARQARFKPTRLEGQPVKVSGVITYSFVLQ